MTVHFDCKIPAAPAFVLSMIILLSGCQTPPKRDPLYSYIRPSIPVAETVPTGAIYNPATEVRLFEDHKARRIGDILTVQLVENTDASKSADTSTDKQTSTDISNPTVLGVSPQFALPGFLPLSGSSNLNYSTNIDANRQFSGSGESNQENSLNGTISVSVVEVFPNGNLAIRGEKRMTLNNGNEYIRLSGVIRPSDISAGNTILSTQIADATIMYTGDGPVAESNIMGWLARFFISAVFPF